MTGGDWDTRNHGRGLGHKKSRAGTGTQQITGGDWDTTNHGRGLGHNKSRAGTGTQQITGGDWDTRNTVWHNLLSKWLAESHHENGAVCISPLSLSTVFFPLNMLLTCFISANSSLNNVSQLSHRLEIVLKLCYNRWFMSQLPRMVSCVLVPACDFLCPSPRLSFLGVPKSAYVFMVSIPCPSPRLSILLIT
ncbi:hypothetical protein LSTR_LSTR004449 [Laodelphax striatellus]|uniref:Uncharacterized protein n=1 Tax=Laodelphax striatellus TaxID=195883 RepID=A0A482XAJ5_LAOST|nr:hypothetical protein LSTR_LSTR004449 [Laodelphax striatellus]